MATFAEIVSEVKVITNRPDLDSEIKSAVKAATLKCHHTDYYPKDLFETGISWASPGFLQSLEYRTVIPRYRAFKFLRKYDAIGNTPGTFFTLLTPEQIFDSYGIHRENVCYLAGEMLEIRSNTADTYMLFGCYLHPIITEIDYSSWIANEYPYAIIYEAARTLFKQIGFNEQSAQMTQLVQEQFSELRNSNILAYGE